MTPNYYNRMSISIIDVDFRAASAFAIIYDSKNKMLIFEIEPEDEARMDIQMFCILFLT